MKLGQRGEPVHVHMTDEQRAEARRRSRLWVLYIVGGGVLVGVIGGIIGAVLPHHRHSAQRHHSATGAVIGIVVALVIIGLALALLTWMYRRQSFQQLFQFRTGRRFRVVKALRKGRPISDEDLPVAAASVSTMQRQWWQVYLFPFLALIFVIQVFDHHGAMRWFYIACVGLYLMTWPITLIQRRQILRNWDQVAPRYREITPSPPGQT